MIGNLRTHTASADDTLVELPRRYSLGYTELIAANPGVDPWMPEEGTAIRLPSAHLLPQAPQRGIVVNLAQQRLFYFPPDGGGPLSFPIGTGKIGWETRLGTTQITMKRANPTWIPPPSIRELRPNLPAAIGPGPHNPLGRYALNLGWPHYVIHGTNIPFGIGRRVSHGCLRLYPEDIEKLFSLVEVGTEVTVVDQPILVGWHDGRLYLEAHLTQQQADDLERNGHFAPSPPQELYPLIREVAGDSLSHVDWPRVAQTVQARSGVPVAITP